MNYDLESNQRDVFLCHASEDKATIVEPLTQTFKEHGITYWCDQADLSWGDSLFDKIKEGLRVSRYVLLVLSINFLNKSWPHWEINEAYDIEASIGKVIILPLLCGSDTDREYILDRLSIIKDRVHLIWENDPRTIASALFSRLQTDKAVDSRPLGGRPKDSNQLQRQTVMLGEKSTADKTKLFDIGKGYRLLSWLFIGFSSATLLIFFLWMLINPAIAALYREASIAFITGLWLWIIIGILLQFIGDSYVKAYYRYPLISRRINETVVMLPFGKKWRRMWRNSKWYPEFRLALILYIAGLYLSILMIAALTVAALYF